jgi:hypothetical protein
MIGHQMGKRFRTKVSWQSSSGFWTRQGRFWWNTGSTVEAARRTSWCLMTMTVSLSISNSTPKQVMPSTFGIWIRCSEMTTSWFTGSVQLRMGPSPEEGRIEMRSPNQPVERTGALPCSFTPVEYYSRQRFGVSVLPAPVAHLFRSTALFELCQRRWKSSEDIGLHALACSHTPSRPQPPDCSTPPARPILLPRRRVQLNHRAAANRASTGAYSCRRESRSSGHTLHAHRICCISSPCRTRFYCL